MVVRKGKKTAAELCDGEKLDRLVNSTQAGEKGEEMKQQCEGHVNNLVSQVSLHFKNEVFEAGIARNTGFTNVETETWDKEELAEQ